MFIRNESFKQFIRMYPIVTWLIGIHTVLTLLSVLIPPLYDPIRYWAIGSNILVAQGEYWRIITPMFLHGDIGHYLFNNFALFIFGPALERMLGHVKFLGAYLFAGILGNVGTFLFGDPLVVHLGASGAIYGLLGLYVYMIYFRSHLIDAGSRQIVLVILIIGVIYTFLMPNINIYAHLFGFIGGALAGPIVLQPPRRYL